MVFHYIFKVWLCPFHFNWAPDISPTFSTWLDCASHRRVRKNWRVISAKNWDSAAPPEATSCFLFTKSRKIVSIKSWFQVIILLVLHMTAFWKKERKLGIQRWQMKSFSENWRKTSWLWQSAVTKPLYYSCRNYDIPLERHCPYLSYGVYC